jgi:hypothetical protein
MPEQGLPLIAGFDRSLLRERRLRRHRLRGRAGAAASTGCGTLDRTTLASGRASRGPAASEMSGRHELRRHSIASMNSSERRSLPPVAPRAAPNDSERARSYRPAHASCASCASWKLVSCYVPKVCRNPLRRGPCVMIRHRSISWRHGSSVSVFRTGTHLYVTLTRRDVESPGAAVKRG